MPEGAGSTPSPNGSPTSTSSAAQLRGEEAVRLVLASNDRNPKKIALVMQREIDRLRGVIEQGGLPAGAVVLKGEDADAWRAYQALGKPADVKKQLDERQALQQDIAQRDARAARQKTAEQGARALGWNPEALRTLSDDKGWTLEMREIDVADGKGGTTRVSVPHVVTGEGTAAKAEPLDVLVQRDHAVYLPALTAAGGGTSGGGASSTNGTTGSASSTSGAAAPASTTGTRYAAQSAGGTPATPADPVAQRIAERNAAAAARPNPFVLPAQRSAGAL